MTQHRLNKRSFALLAGIALVVTGQSRAVGQDVTVKVSPGVARDIGGYTTVQDDIFGTMYAWSLPEAKPFHREANIGSVRFITHWTANISHPDFKLLPWHGPMSRWNRDRFESMEEFYAWSDRFMTETDPMAYWGGEWNDYDRLLDFTRQGLAGYGDANFIISLSDRFWDARLERTPEAARAHLDALVTVLKREASPEIASRWKYLQLMNEPHQKGLWAGWYRHKMQQLREADADKQQYIDGEVDPTILSDVPEDKRAFEIKAQQLAVESYTRVFNNLYAHMREAHPDGPRMVGTCVGHNAAALIRATGSHPGVDWDTWVKTFIDKVEDPEALAYYNHQRYGVSPVRGLAFTGLTQNYAEITRGVRPRMIITETTIPGPQRSGGVPHFEPTFLFHALDLFMMLEHPDKFALRSAFAVWVNETLSGYSLFDREEDGTVKPLPPFQVFPVLKNVRGENLEVRIDRRTDRDDGLRVFASAPSPRRFTVAVLNPAIDAQQASIDLGVPAAQVRSIVHRSANYRRRQNDAPLHTENLAASGTLSIEVPATSVHAFEVELKTPLPSRSVVRTRDYYGDTVREPMDKPVTVGIAAEKPAAGATAVLRFATDTRLSEGTYRFTFNGREHEVYWADTPQRMVGWVRQPGFFEVPIPTARIVENNVLKLESLNGNTLLSASIVVRER